MTKHTDVSFDKDFEKNLIKAIGVNDANQKVTQWLSTGYLPLDKALSGKYNGGGFPMGRLSEVFGGESSGKTMLATMAMIACQRLGGFAMFLDYEHAFYMDHAMRLGLIDDPMMWGFKQPETAEKGFMMAEKAIDVVRNHFPEIPLLVVYDSIASMVTEEEFKTEFDQANMRTRNSLAMVMSEATKKLSGMASKANAAIIMLNQTRDNVGVMFGDKKKTAGGNALKFYASLRLQLTKTGKVHDKDKNVIGETVVAETKKNKTFKPFQKAQYNSSFTEGIDLHMSHILAAKELGLIESSGSYLVWDGKKKYANDLSKLMRAEPAQYEKLLALFGD